METLTQVAEPVPQVTSRTVAERIVELNKQLEGSKAIYEELDKLTEEFKKLNGVGSEHSLFIDGKAVTLVDNFLDNNVVFRPAAVRRFEVKVEDADKFIKRLKKEAK